MKILLYYHKYHQIIIITKINEPVLFLKFYQICKKKEIFLLKDTEVSAGFLTNNLISKKIVLTLFLDATKTELIQKECLRVNCPLLSFGGLSSSRSSSSLFVGGNYNSFFAQNFILTFYKNYRQLIPLFHCDYIN